LVFPRLFNQWRGEASSRGKREIRDELSFQASDRLRKKRRSCDEPESLASRIYRTLDGVPRNGQWERGTSKCSGHALNLLNTCTHQKTAAFNWYLSATVFGNQPRFGASKNLCTTIITRSTGNFQAPVEI